MIKHGNKILSQYVTIKFSFSGNRVEDCYFYPTVWDLEIDIVALLSRTTSEDSAQDAYQKLKFWIDNVLPDSIVVSGENEVDMSLAALPDNNIIVLPGAPTNDVLVRVIHSKLTSLSDGHIIIGKISLGSSDTDVVQCYSLGPAGYELPETTDYYFSQDTIHAVPWWSRTDGFTFEMVDVEESSRITDPLDLYKQMSGITDKDCQTLANVVKMTKWVPKAV